MNPKDTAISQYQKWKQDGEMLRTQAKQAMESRFRELLAEAMQLAEEYKTDFKGALKPPPSVTAFRYKASGRPKKSKAAAKKAIAAAAPSPKVAVLEKQLGQARKKLEAAKGAGKPTKNLEDKVYEIEDDLRLARES